MPNTLSGYYDAKPPASAHSPLLGALRRRSTKAKGHLPGSCIRHRDSRPSSWEISETWHNGRYPSTISRRAILASLEVVTVPGRSPAYLVTPKASFVTQMGSFVTHC